MDRPTAAGRWIERNAKWVVPLLVVGFIGAATLGVIGLMNWLDGYMRGLPPYRMALQELRSHREAAQFLGSPIQAAGRLQGNVRTTNARSSANLVVPVQGEKHSGRLMVTATAEGEDWTLHRVTLEVTKPKRSFTIVREE